MMPHPNRCGIFVFTRSGNESPYFLGTVNSFSYFCAPDQKIWNKKIFRVGLI